MLKDRNLGSIKTKQNKLAYLENFYDVIVIKKRSSPKIVFIASQASTKAAQIVCFLENLKIIVIKV